MKGKYLSVVFMLIGIFGVGLDAHAQDQDTFVAKVPYDFVAGGRLMSKGTYRVSRIDGTAGWQELKISSSATHESVLLIPSAYDDIKSGQGQLNFERVGDKYFLAAVKTPAGTYGIEGAQSVIKLADKEQKLTASSGSH